MGITDISMNAASIPTLKYFIRHRAFNDAKRHLKQVLLMEDAEEIEVYLDNILS
jgi:phosphoenolpyruvate-protein kinase (PTS system EI component)